MELFSCFLATDIPALHGSGCTAGQLKSRELRVVPEAEATGLTASFGTAQLEKLMCNIVIVIVLCHYVVLHVFDFLKFVVAGLNPSCFSSHVAVTWGCVFCQAISLKLRLIESTELERIGG